MTDGPPREYEVEISCSLCGRTIKPILTRSRQARIFLRNSHCATCGGTLIATGEVRARTSSTLPFDLTNMRSLHHLGRPSKAEMEDRRLEAFRLDEELRVAEADLRDFFKAAS